MVQVKQGLPADACETSRDISFCGHTIQTADAFVVEDMLADPRFRDNPLVIGPPHVRFYAGVPLRTPDGYNVGSLCINDTVPRSFDMAKLEILKSFAAVVVDELELRLIAQNDHLTGALSRRAFLAEIDKSLLAARPEPHAKRAHPARHRPIQTDQRHARHAAATGVLRALASGCMGTLRAGDCFGRLGGEEFGILLPQASASDATRCVERFRKLISQLQIRHDPPFIDHRASFGVAPIDASYRDANAWLAAADTALYAAKALGRTAGA